MSDVWGEDASRAWAAQRGLAFEGEGLFPAATPLLREGLGEGPHRAGLITRETAHSTTSVGGFSKKPERHTANICRGRLPGGIDGALGHHFHLEYRSDGDDSSWLAVPHTVVLAYVPEGARVCRELRFVNGGWITDPPESGQDVAELTRDAVIPPGYDSTVEMRDGMLCVAVRGVVEDPALLDGLCRMAAAVADGARRVAARYPALDPTVPTRAQVLPPDLQWVEVAAQQLQWPEPPESVPVAMAAYAGLHGGRHEATQRKVGATAFVALFVLGAIWIGFDLLLAFVFDMPLEAAAAVLIGLFAIPGAVRAALRFGREAADDEVAVRSRLPGLEAFARSYAESRGMGLEDRDEFRRRFTSPVPGAPLKVMYGSLGDEVTGRIVLWIARDERFEARYWNMAVVPAPAGEPPTVLPQFQVWRDGDVMTIAEQVPDEGRSVERLNALRATAVRAVRAVRGDGRDRLAPVSRVSR